MTVRIVRDLSGPMRHQVRVRNHTLVVDVDTDAGGEDAGPTPHDLYDSALGACKALTMLVYAKRKNIPVENIEVTVERDASEESKGTYRLKALVSITGNITDAQRDDLLRVAGKCPVHKLMTQATTEIETVFA